MVETLKVKFAYYNIKSYKGGILMIYESGPFCIEEGSEVELTPIEISKCSKENKNITKGVLLKNDVPAANYILKVFKNTKNGKLTFIGFTFTDSFGQFTIPLSATKAEYTVKVYSLTEEVENLELILQNS